MWVLAVLFFLIAASGPANCNALQDDDDVFNVGVGIGDVTGPAAELGMMGYASLTQSARGIHTRLYARAFEFESNGERVVYVSADIGMCDQAIKTEVVSVLQAKYGPDLYTYQNVLISGTHTHSGPAGYIQYLLYGITSLGFNQINFRAIVEGIVESIEKAHNSLQPGRLLFNHGEVEGANINRSPTSYLANPEEERAKYEHDVDKGMSLVKVVTLDGKPLGTINWFAVHPTSMNNTNSLISGDNKGYASMLFEYEMNPNERPGKGDFVAAFGSSNLGDVSPNTQGAKCIDTGLPCEANSTCCGPLGCFVAKCIAFGPGKDMEDSTKIVGERQYRVAQELFESATEVIRGPVQFKHQFVNMSMYEVEITNSNGQKETKKLCKAALGFGFAAGTTDGPGAFDFVQGVTVDNPHRNPFWDFIKDYLINATVELEECQKPKPILLAVGEAHFPYDWSPSVVETQVLRIGNLYILGVPGELTTMAGRRLKAVIDELIKTKLPDAPEPRVVVAGLSNVYTHYISTFEEYQEQRYEAASTLYGQYTLDAYLQQFPKLVDWMLANEEDTPAGPSPPNLLDKQFSLVAPVVQDFPPFSMNFGDVIEDAEPSRAPGDLVTAIFAGGHPKNNMMRGGTFFVIERAPEDDLSAPRWDLVRTDADWDTKFRWKRPFITSKQNHIEVSWQIPEDMSEGFYRIRHFGYYKPSPLHRPRPYHGNSAVFQVAKPGTATKKHPLWNPERKPSKKMLTARDFWNGISQRILQFKP